MPREPLTLDYVISGEQALLVDASDGTTLGVFPKELAPLVEQLADMAKLYAEARVLMPLDGTKARSSWVRRAFILSLEPRE